MSRVNTKEIGVALLGFGTVGAGVVETLQKNGSLLAARLGVRPVLRGIADLDLTSDRGVSVEPGLLTTDGAALIARPDVQVVVELIGGSGVAKDFVLQALKLGKPVVTVFLSLRTLPPKPARYRRHRSIFMVIQWLYLPVTTIVFNSFAALYSQTRLMLGKYVSKFDVTDKAVVSEGVGGEVKTKL